MSYTCSLCCLCLPSFWVVWFVTLYSISWHFISLWAYKNKPQAAVVVSFTVFDYSLHLLRWNKQFSKESTDVCSETRSTWSQWPWESGVTAGHRWGTHWTVCVPELNWSNVSLGQGGLKELFYEDENFLIFFLFFYFGGGSFYRSSDGNSYAKKGLSIVIPHSSGSVKKEMFIC